MGLQFVRARSPAMSWRELSSRVVFACSTFGNVWACNVSNMSSRIMTASRTYFGKKPRLYGLRKHCIGEQGLGSQRSSGNPGCCSRALTHGSQMRGQKFGSRARAWTIVSRRLDMRRILHLVLSSVGREQQHASARIEVQRLCDRNLHRAHWPQFFLSQILVTQAHI